MNEPIRVAHIMGKMLGGGVEAMVMNYYRHINREKVQFDFIVDEDSTIVPQEEIENLGGAVYTIPPYQKSRAYHKALVKLFSEKNYSIVHSHINTLSVFPLYAAKRAGVPVRIAHSHSTAGKGELKRNILKYTLRPFSKRYPTHFFACSKYAGRWLFGKKANFAVVKNAIDISNFQFCKQVRQTMRNELGIENKFVVGHAGRFTKQKNHSFLLDIFHEVFKQNPNAILLLIGEGELEQDVRKKIAYLNLSDNVQLLGVRGDVAKLMQAMDVFLLPSLYEGLPVVGVEAQMAGISVVASDVITQEVKLSENFIFLPLEMPASNWAENILSLDLTAREDASKKALASGYDIRTAAEELCRLYERCLG